MATASITNPTELSEAFGKIHACIDRTIPPQLIGEALTRAVNERPDNILRPSMAPGVGMAQPLSPAPCQSPWWQRSCGNQGGRCA